MTETGGSGAPPVKGMPKRSYVLLALMGRKPLKFF